MVIALKPFAKNNVFAILAVLLRLFACKIRNIVISYLRRLSPASPQPDRDGAEPWKFTSCVSAPRPVVTVVAVVAVVIALRPGWEPGGGYQGTSVPSQEWS